MSAAKFLIIDGSSIVYRAFYALPLLQNKRGEQTNAVYGFTSMLIGIFEKTGPDFGAVVFDKPGPTFRHDLFADYKAHRESAPEELNEQINRIKEIVEAYRFPIYEMDEYEADDIIGTLVKKAEERKIESLIFSGDTDLFQLISDYTKVIIVRKGISVLHEYDSARLWERYNLKPEQMVDFMGLKGDPSDNIPGVPGIGEKTALKLLHEYGNLDRVLVSTPEMKGRLRENLELYRDQALLSRDLATIRCRIEELDFNWDQCLLSVPDYERLRNVFHDLEFKSLLNRLPAVEAMPENKQTTLSCQIPVTSIKQLRKIIASSENPSVALLVKTGQHYPRWKDTPRAIAFAMDESCGYYFDPSLFSSGSWGAFLKELLGDGRPVKLLGHHTKPLLNIMSILGMDVPHPEFDSMLAAYLLDPGRADLSTRAIINAYLDINLGEPPSGKEAVNDNELQARLLAEEAPHLFKLRGVLEDKLTGYGLAELYRNVELPLLPVLSRMELQGISVNREKIDAISEEIKVQIDNLREEIFLLAGEEFNLNSPRQLSCILFEKLKMPVIKRTKTGYSTDASVLEELAQEHEIVTKILYYRHLVKLEGTYLTGLVPYIDGSSGKIYTTFNQAVTATGRLSSSDPNLQNIPVRMPEGRRIRIAFIPSRKDCIFLAADYSQIELRVLAHLSQDPTLIDAFRKDEDIHCRTAAEIFGVALEGVTPEMRRRAKTVNFGIVYGMSDYGLAQDLKVPRREAQEY
ncbi:MAG: DNA polymerase I, partial [Firmicutes bacterium]|nr:DNA polymerase I [Bacillota bacterium]